MYHLKVAIFDKNMAVGKSENLVLCCTHTNSSNLQSRGFADLGMLRLKYIQEAWNHIRSKVFTYAVKHSTNADLFIYIFHNFTISRKSGFYLFFSKLAIWCTLIIQVIFLGCSTCPLDFGCWDLSHVIFLMLRITKLLAKLSKFSKWQLFLLKTTT